MRDLDQHLAALNSRAPRRASLGNMPNTSDSRSLPPALDSVFCKQKGHLFVESNKSCSKNNCNSHDHGGIPMSPKKQSRRASLGQMLGNAQKFFTKDDAATLASDNSSYNGSVSSGSTEPQRKATLKEVKQLIKHQTARKAEMEVNIASDLELAKARLSSGNQLGAILSMRRVHRNTTMLAYAAAARYQLSQIRDTLEHDAGSDVPQQRRLMRDITEKLLKADAPSPDDAFLLHQLESQMGEVGF